jgi:6-phosphogluconolactonase/glucosamine-6-phosphate isomerase/deaminase
LLEILKMEIVISNTKTELGRSVAKQGANLIRKAISQNGQAVKKVIEGPITPVVPASILQQHKSTFLYLDIDSSNLISKKR